MNDSPSRPPAGQRPLVVSNLTTFIEAWRRDDLVTVAHAGAVLEHLGVHVPVLKRHDARRGGQR